MFIKGHIYLIKDIYQKNLIKKLIGMNKKAPGSAIKKHPQGQEPMI